MLHVKLVSSTSLTGITLTALTSILTHWGRVTHICVSNLTIIASDNGLSPGRRQAIIWTNAEILLIGHLGTNFSETLIEILIFSFKKMHLKVSSAKRRPFCLGLNVLTEATALCCMSGWFLPHLCVMGMTLTALTSILKNQCHSTCKWMATGVSPGAL